MVEQADEVRRGHDRYAAGPACLPALRRRTDQPLVRAGSMERRQQHTRRRHDPAIKRQFADRNEIDQLLGIGHAHCCQQRQRDRQVIVRAFLGQVSGRKVDGDPLGRQRQAHRGQRSVDPFAAFIHRLVGQADQIETRQAGRDLALDFHGTSLKPEIGNCLDQRDQAYPLLQTLR